jgi:Capsular polysaccharide synthesis protein
MPDLVRRTIWQYWETRGTKPAFVDGLRTLAQRNSACEVRLVTPQSLHVYLPNLPRAVLNIKEIAHRADMIRTMLVAEFGGMWLDSDAIVLKDLNWIFDCLAKHEFVGFNDGANLGPDRPWLRVNCFASRKNGTIVTEWMRLQHEKLPRTTFGWEEIGTELLHPICLSRPDLVKVLPFDSICPIPWNEVGKFMTVAPAEEIDEIIERCSLVMLSNASLKRRAPKLRCMTCQQIAEQESLVGLIMRAALRGDAVDAVPSARKLASHALIGGLKRFFGAS